MCLGSHFWNEIRPQTFIEACPGRENKNPVPYGMRQDIEEVANRASAKYIACELGFGTASNFIFSHTHTHTVPPPPVVPL